MKKIMMMAVAAAFMCGCGNDGELAGRGDSECVKDVTFEVNGDFAVSFSDMEMRTALTDETNTMTDLWVFDYKDGQCVQSLHQTSGDAQWGTPTLSLKFGTHKIYFVASRGAEPVVDADNHVISFGTVRDTFWKMYTIDVTSSTNASRTVAMDRVVTRLRLTATDEVPEGLATVTITPAKWYNGVDYLTGEPAAEAVSTGRVVNVPSSYAGTSGDLIINVFGFSGDDFSTNIDVLAKTTDGTTVGQASVANAPFKRNRSTEMSGTLFGKVSVNTITIDDEWLDDYEMTF